MKRIILFVIIILVIIIIAWKSRHKVKGYFVSVDESWECAVENPCKHGEYTNPDGSKYTPKMILHPDSSQYPPSTSEMLRSDIGKCICDKGYGGADCSVGREGCSGRGIPMSCNTVDDDCINASYRCICDPNVTGNKCQYGSEVCHNQGLPALCLKGDRCTSEKYECKCKKGFIGLHCQFPDDSCNNLGHAQSPNSDEAPGTCVCDYPFISGNKCELGDVTDNSPAAPIPIKSLPSGNYIIYPSSQYPNNPQFLQSERMTEDGAFEVKVGGEKQVWRYDAEKMELSNDFGYLNAGSSVYNFYEPGKYVGLCLPAWGNPAEELSPVTVDKKNFPRRFVLGEHGEIFSVDCQQFLAVNNAGNEFPRYRLVNMQINPFGFSVQPFT